VVSFFYVSAFLRYLTPISGSPVELIFSVQYGVVTPLVNPLIYSLKNKELKAAVRRTLNMYLLFSRPEKKKKPEENGELE